MSEELEKIIIEFKHPAANARKVLNADQDAWPELLVEFCNVLNDAGFKVPVESVEEMVYTEDYKNVISSKIHSLDQLEINFDD